MNTENRTDVTPAELGLKDKQDRLEQLGYVFSADFKRADKFTWESLDGFADGCFDTMPQAIEDAWAKAQAEVLADTQESADDGKKVSASPAVPMGAKPGLHFGGSILPSSDPRILEPLKGAHGTLTVVPLVEAQEYGLFFEREIEVYRQGAKRKEMGRSMLATHANGYSCRSLAERIVAAWESPIEFMVDKAMAQFDYIMSCGGLGMKRESIIDVVLPPRD